MTAQEYIAIVRAAYNLELARAYFSALLLRAGLDPGVPLRYDDGALTITSVTPGVGEQE